MNAKEIWYWMCGKCFDTEHPTGAKVLHKKNVNEEECYCCTRKGKFAVLRDQDAEIRKGHEVSHVSSGDDDFPWLAAAIIASSGSDSDSFSESKAASEDSFQGGESGGGGASADFSSDSGGSDCGGGGGGD